MAVIYPYFLSRQLAVHDALQAGTAYPFFDPACVCYEALRAVRYEQQPREAGLTQFGLTDHQYRQALAAFERVGTAGLIGLTSRQLTEPLAVESERRVVVLKAARPALPATTMVLLLQGFGDEVALALMRHLYASYGWAQGTRVYQAVDFVGLNRRVMQLEQWQCQPLSGREGFFHPDDPLQQRLEVFRTLDQRGITQRYPGSRVRFSQHKHQFLSLGLLGLVEQAPAPFRNSKLGFKEEGWLILSKIQHPDRDDSEYLRQLRAKHIEVDRSCLSKIFTRWQVEAFQSPFVGELQRLLAEPQVPTEAGALDRTELAPDTPVALAPLRLDSHFVRYVQALERHPVALAQPGLFLFLPYLQRLRLLEKVAEFVPLEPEQGYSWFTLLVLDVARLLGGLRTASRACHTYEPSLPLVSGLVAMPSNDALLNGLASLSEPDLLVLRRYLTRRALADQLIEGRHVALDFHLHEFSGEDAPLKHIGKAPSPKRQICFPGFRPHLAWDVATGVPIALEFRNGRARATTTVERFIRERLVETLGAHTIEHIYLDSEYTAEHVWQFVVDPQHGLGADLTMCVKQNKRVKKLIQAFLATSPSWGFFDAEHTYTEQTFEIPIAATSKSLHCVLKRHEPSGRLRGFGSTLPDLDARAILREYGRRWTVENGIKDLIGEYYLDHVPGIDPHRINLHDFVVSLARLLLAMRSRDYPFARHADGTLKSIGSLRSLFLTGVNATRQRQHHTLVRRWLDRYPEPQHQALSTLFDRLNQTSHSEGLAFLGGLRLKFEIAEPRPPQLQNRLKRVPLEF